MRISHFPQISAIFCALVMGVGRLVAAPEAPPFPHKHSDLPADPAVTWGTLKNGLRYAVMHHAEPPGRLSMRLHIGAGSLHEREEQRGLAHFLEHMAFNGSKNFKADELVSLLQNAGIAFGADLNAYTSFDETVYMLDLPENKDPLIDKCFTVLRDWADGLLLEESEIEKERGVILSEKRDRDSVEMRLMEEQFKAVMPEALVTNRFPIGTEAVISGAKRDLFVDFYKKYYTPDRATVIVVGDVEPAQMEARIQRYFDSMQPLVERAPDPDLGKLTPTGLKFQAFQDSEVKATEVGITKVGVSTEQPDSKAERTRVLPSMLAHAMLSRRLEILTKKEGSPIVEGSSSRSDFLRFAQITSIDATAVGERWEDALSLIEQELRRALEHGFSQAELDEVSAKLVRSLEEAVKAASTRKSADIAIGISQSINDQKVFTTPATELAVFQNALPGISPEKCTTALREDWSGPDRFVAITVKEPVAEAERAIADVYQKSLATPVAAPAATSTLEFAYQTVGSPGTIRERKHHDDLGITQLVLSNNVRVNFKATDFEKNTIEMIGRFGGGKLEQPKNKPGLDFFASAVFNGGGLVAHSNDDLERLFAGKKLGIGFAVVDDAFTLSGKTTREDLHDQLRLFCAYVQYAGYREEGERQFRNSLPILAMQMSTTPDGVFGSRGERLLRGGDLRFGMESIAELETYQRDAVKSWLEPALKEAAMEVSIVGDFDPGELESLLLDTLAALPVRKSEKPSYQEARIIPALPVGKHVLEYDSKVPKALNLVFWPTADRSDIQRTRRLGILGEVLGDRLRVKIREEMGEAYSPNAGASASDVWKDDGYILCHSPGDPSHSAKVIDYILDIAKTLAEKGVTEEELGRALKPTFSGIETQRRTNAYWLGTVLSRSQEKPEVLDWARTLEADFKKITVAEVSALAKQYLPAERATTLIITTAK